MPRGQKIAYGEPFTEIVMACPCGWARVGRAFLTHRALEFHKRSCEKARDGPSSLRGTEKRKHRHDKIIVPKGRLTPAQQNEPHVDGFRHVTGAGSVGEEYSTLQEMLESLG